jgi:hypothetical protein
MSNSKNTKKYFLEDTKAKFPLLEIDPELTKVMPPDEVIELVGTCVSLSGYSRNDIRNAFFRALSIPALDVYIDEDQRCKVAINIVINGLENRFPDKPKLEYEWKGDYSNISELKVIDKYGNGLFTEYWIAEHPELDGTREVDDALEVQGILEVPEILEVHDAHVHINTGDVDVPGVTDALEVQNTPEINDVTEVAESPEVQDAPEIHGGSEEADVSEVKEDLEVEEDSKVVVALAILDASDAQEVHATSEVSDASTIPDANVHNTNEAVAPEIISALKVDNAQEDADTPSISDAPEVDSAHEDDSSQVNNVPEDGLAQEDDRTEVHNVPEDSDAVEFADAQEIHSTLEVHDNSEVHDAPIIGDASKAPEPMNEVPELVQSSPSPVKKRTKKASEASNNTMILEQILHELREIKALLKDNQ